MAGRSVEVTIYPGPMAAQVGQLSQRALVRAGQRTKARVQQNIIASGRVDTGRMLRSVRYSIVKVDPYNPVISVYTGVHYARYQEHGTRAHGPVRAPYLVFRPKGSRKLVFAKRVRGVKAAHFMQKALLAVRAADFLP